MENNPPILLYWGTAGYQTKLLRADIHIAAKFTPSPHCLSYLKCLLSDIFIQFLYFHETPVSSPILVTRLWITQFWCRSMCEYQNCTIMTSPSLACNFSTKCYPNHSKSFPSMFIIVSPYEINPLRIACFYLIFGIKVCFNLLGFPFSVTRCIVATKPKRSHISLFAWNNLNNKCVTLLTNTFHPKTRVVFKSYMQARCTLYEF